MKEDRISQFPDEILQHIISYLDFHECLRTSILSKRWKHLCRSLPDLRFNFPSTAFFDPFFFPYLLHCDKRAPVDSLHLSFDEKFDLKAMKNSMIYAINHGVQSLRLHAPHRGLTTLRLPVKLLTSTTLRELELRLLSTLIHVPGRFLLPNLKTLCLETNFIFDGDHGMETFSDLPELEISLCVGTR